MTHHDPILRRTDPVYLGPLTPAQEAVRRRWALAALSLGLRHPLRPPRLPARRSRVLDGRALPHVRR